LATAINITSMMSPWSIIYQVNNTI